MLISIIIPTYNRSKYLLKNLSQLSLHIEKINTVHFEIVISNNCSTDDSDKRIREFIIKNPKLRINYIVQDINLGVAKNCLIVFKEAKGDYIIYLGDDDYLEFNYLNEIAIHLTKNDQTHCILPSIVVVDMEGDIVKKGRDFGKPNKLYKAGFRNCKSNSWRAHQLSGVVIKRKGLYSRYKNKDRGNMYIFIHFAAFCSLNGDTYHLTKYPVRVTDPGQKNKDWDYEEDGLVTEIFDNYNNLSLNYFQKTLLQLEIIKRQPYRIWQYREKGLRVLLVVLWNIQTSKNSTLLFKIIFPFQVINLYIKGKLLQKGFIKC